jgi:hypothetical protein
LWLLFFSVYVSSLLSYSWQKLRFLVPIFQVITLFFLLSLVYTASEFQHKHIVTWKISESFTKESSCFWGALYYLLAEMIITQTMALSLVAKSLGSQLFSGCGTNSLFYLKWEIMVNDYFPHTCLILRRPRSIFGCSSILKKSRHVSVSISNKGMRNGGPWKLIPMWIPHHSLLCF